MRVSVSIFFNTIIVIIIRKITINLQLLKIVNIIEDKFTERIVREISNFQSCVVCFLLFLLHKIQLCLFGFLWCSKIHLFLCGKSKFCCFFWVDFSTYFLVDIKAKVRSLWKFFFFLKWIFRFLLTRLSLHRFSLAVDVCVDSLNVSVSFLL